MTSHPRAKNPSLHYGKPPVSRNRGSLFLILTTISFAVPCLGIIAALLKQSRFAIMMAGLASLYELIQSLGIFWVARQANRQPNFPLIPLLNSLSHHPIESECVEFDQLNIPNHGQESLDNATTNKLFPMANQPWLGVIVPAWNELTGLPRTLNSLALQTESADLIIVADDGSQDGSIDNLQITYEVTWQTMDGYLLGHSQIQPNLYVLRKEHSGKADSINQALGIIHNLRPLDPHVTASDIILILDADTQLLPNSIAALRQTWLQYPHLTAIGGLLLPSCEGHSLITRLLEYYQKYEYVRVHIWRLAWSHLHSSLIMSGACAAFRRDILETIGGFNSRSWVEDYEIMYRLHRHFHQKNQLCEVMIHPQVVVRTDAPGDMESWLRQRRRWSGGFLETMYLHREMVGQKRYGILGQVYLVHNALSIAMPFYGCLGLISGTIIWLNDASFLLENSSLISVIFILRLALGLSITAMSLQLYRHHYHQKDLSYTGLIVSELLSFLFYGVLGSLSYLWGYLTFFRRQRHW